MNPAELEKVLRYWNQQAEDFDAIYSGAKPGWGRLLDRWLRRDMYQRLRWVLEQSGDVREKSVCDLGCGSGRYVIAYAQQGAGRIVGVDASPAMIQKAQAVAAAAGVLQRCQFRVLDILNYPDDQRFDITLAVGVFDYLEDPAPFLARIRRITAGRFLATFPRQWSWRMPIRRMRLGLLGCPVYFYTPGKIQAWLSQTGFELKRIDRIGAIFCVLAVPAPMVAQAASQEFAPDEFQQART